VAGELDSRGSHYYLAMYWAHALAEQAEDSRLAEVFAPLARRLAENESTIIDELAEVQGRQVELGGHYYYDRAKADEVMRPSATFNSALEEFTRS
jgi:isocitrate dehydrogenase